MVHTAPPKPITLHLRLGALAAVYEQHLAIYGNSLCRRVPAKCRKCGIVTKYCYFQDQNLKVKI